MFTSEIDPELELTTLIFQWLSERGYSQTLERLEAESAITYNPELVQFGSQLESVYNEHKHIQMSMKLAEEEVEDMTDAELNELGDSRFPQHLLDTLDKVHTSNILCMRFSPFDDSHIVVTGSTDKTIKVTNYLTKEVLYTFIGVSDAPMISLDFNPVNPELLLASSVDGSCSILRVPKDGVNCECIETYRQHKKYVVRARWSPDGQSFATCSYDKSIAHYKKDDQGKYSLVKVWDFPNTIESLIYTPDSKYIVAGVRESNYLHYLNVDDFTITRYNMNINGDDHVSFSAMEFSVTDKYLLVSTDRNRLILFKLHSDKQMRNFYGASNDQYTTTRNKIDPSGKYVYSTSQDHYLFVWEIATQKVVAKLDHHKLSVRDLDFSPNRDLLASCGFDKKVCLWSISKE
ncbi:hypothetical protein CYY_005497 [Polysphondylium violaceum]|uniref:WD40 repeat-containing protein n=1 Tax=Polysphondylium violaceum TaxID=133409 RepID=A0A8J4PSX6_9MYCE|nr:hypothetical protein CYY_005497 [Polysphondylium violaceum]